jgi:hypothetical protein
MSTHTLCSGLGGMVCLPWFAWEEALAAVGALGLAQDSYLGPALVAHALEAADEALRTRLLLLRCCCWGRPRAVAAAEIINGLLS